MLRFPPCYNPCLLILEPLQNVCFEHDRMQALHLASRAVCDYCLQGLTYSPSPLLDLEQRTVLGIPIGGSPTPTRNKMKVAQWVKCLPLKLRLIPRILVLGGKAADGSIEL